MKLVRIHYHSDRQEIIDSYQLEYHPEQLALYEEMGIIDLEDGGLTYKELRRLKKIIRLKKNCAVNTIGASIIVDLLDRIEELEDEIKRMRGK